MRRLWPNLLILGLLGCAAFEVVTGREHWPFSPYPMFAEAETPKTVSRVRVIGTDAGGVEVPIVRSGQTPPLDPIRLRSALTKLSLDGPTRLKRAAWALMVMHDESMPDGDEGQHRRLRRLRIERVVLPLGRSLSLTELRTPLAREVLVEVRR